MGRSPRVEIAAIGRGVRVFNNIGYMVERVIVPLDGKRPVFEMNGLPGRCGGGVLQNFPLTFGKSMWRKRESWLV